MNETIKKVANFIHTHALLSDGAKVAVGLSGGPDSVCLATILHHLGYEVIASHANFHLRGDESLRDEKFVEALCMLNGWPLQKVDFDTTEYAQTQKISIEMAARELRYNWFRKIKNTLRAEAIAVGHHQNDNIETLLLNLTRGTGIVGLCGMPPKHGDVIRPLLCLTQQEILSFLYTSGINYVFDHTNAEDIYARNKVRHNVLPELQRINSGAAQNIISTMENLQEIQKIYRHTIEAGIAACCTHKDNGEQYINLLQLQLQPSPITLLHEILSPLGFNKQQLKEMLASVGKSGKLFTARERRVLIDRKHLIIESQHYPFPTIHQKRLPIQEVTIQKTPSYAYLDADKLHGSLTLRTPQPGDTFAPFGMHGRRKLLSDYLTDQKLTLFEKEHQPILVDGNEIVWVVGRRSSELYRVDHQTRQVLTLQV